MNLAGQRKHVTKLQVWWNGWPNSLDTEEKRIAEIKQSTGEKKNNAEWSLEIKEEGKTKITVKMGSRR